MNGRIPPFSRAISRVAAMALGAGTFAPWMAAEPAAPVLLLQKPEVRSAPGRRLPKPLTASASLPIALPLDCRPAAGSCAELASQQVAAP